MGGFTGVAQFVKGLIDGRPLGAFTPQMFGAKGNGVADDGPAILAAIAAAHAAGGGDVYFPWGTYLVDSTLALGYTNIRLIGGGGGGIFAGPTIKYTGAASATTPVVSIANQAHGCGVKGLVIDANGLAGLCLHVQSNAALSTATFGLDIGYLTLKGYTSRAGVIGLNDTATGCAMQLDNLVIPALKLIGGSAGALGLLVNAQNAEIVSLPGFYSTPTPGIEHANHIYLKRGAVHLSGATTTRATGYAVYAEGPVHAHGWNAEDRYILDLRPLDPGGPMHLAGILQRPDASFLAADVAINLRANVRPVILDGVELQSSISVGATSAIVGKAHVRFALSGAGFAFGGPSNARGLFHALDAGDLQLRGTAPALTVADETGAAVGGFSKALGMLIPNISALPAASATYRGRIFRVMGAAGVADGLWICEKNAADVHVWRAL